MKRYQIVLISISVLIVISIMSLFIAYLIISSNVKLDMELLSNIENSPIALDDNDNPINTNSYTEIGNISKNIVNAFLSIEDVRFYKHKGIDVKRMLGASVKNIGSFKFKEGASTITQQLIKNTHLSNEKSLERKIKEIKLARELEKKLSKDEILEKYLNVIYFGNGIYGVGEAAEYYFNSKADKLNVSEGAMLAGIVKSPNNYNPVSSTENAEKRMKTVLKTMKNNGFIDESTYADAINYKYKPDRGYFKNNYSEQYYKLALIQAAEILNTNVKEINANKYVIGTYMNEALQKNCFSRLSSMLYSAKDSSGTFAAAENNKGRLLAYASSESFPYKRSCGSIIKPLAVYAPALELNAYTLATPIRDEITDFNGYSPKNYGGATHGNVSLKEAIMHSYNIPAVKVLSDISVDSAADYLKSMNFNIEEKDKNLSLALGTNSADPINILSAYMTFPRGGDYIGVSAVKYIKDKDGNVLYNDNRAGKRVFNEDTAYLITDALTATAKNGTASKLKHLNIDIAAKTGTVGDESGNSDAYCAAYTNEYTFLSWLGAENGNKLPVNVTGGSQPTMLVKNVIENMRGYRPKAFAAPESIVIVPIDNEAIRKGEPIRYKADGEKYSFSRFNAPLHPRNTASSRHNINNWLKILFGA